jgi:hypothetical protein
MKIKKRKAIKAREYSSFGAEVYYDVVPEDKKGHEIQRLRKGFDRKIDAKMYGEELVYSGLAVRSRLITMTVSGVYLGDSYFSKSLE